MSEQSFILAKYFYKAAYKELKVSFNSATVVIILSDKDQIPLTENDHQLTNQPILLTIAYRQTKRTLKI
jgi:hypothetical protein